jgi:hypothetical protein
MSQTATLAIIPVVAAIGLLGIVVIEPIFVAQHQDEAAGPSFPRCFNNLDSM